MAQTQTVGTHRTSTFTENGITHIQYHSTRVVSFSADSITLRTGGWKTATTKTRMNQVSNQYDLGYRVFQNNFEWCVDYKNNIRHFDGDSIELPR